MIMASWLPRTTTPEPATSDHFEFQNKGYRLAPDTAGNWMTKSWANWAMPTVATKRVTRDALNKRRIIASSTNAAKSPPATSATARAIQNGQP